MPRELEEEKDNLFLLSGGNFGPKLNSEMSLTPIWNSYAIRLHH